MVNPQPFALISVHSRFQFFFPNVPAQARRAKGLQSETTAQNRRCLQSAGSTFWANKQHSALNQLIDDVDGADKRGFGRKERKERKESRSVRAPLCVLCVLCG